MSYKIKITHDDPEADNSVIIRVYMWSEGLKECKIQSYNLFPGGEYIGYVHPRQTIEIVEGIHHRESSPSSA